MLKLSGIKSAEHAVQEKPEQQPIVQGASWELEWGLLETVRHSAESDVALSASAATSAAAGAAWEEEATAAP
jgi:hypothetical protein